MTNLVGKVPPLEASGAAVTKVHPTATTVVGGWNVTYPNDMPEEQKPNLGPTRTFGYAHRLVEKPPRFARRHVRRDISIDARDVNGWSDAESQLDAAARELSGDIVFQRTLTGDQLNGLVPNVDFKQGDVLPLLVWGMVIPATCTSIRYTLVDGVAGVEVGFGPSLMADVRGLADTMLQIDRQMRAEAAGIDQMLADQLDAAKGREGELKAYVDRRDGEVGDAALEAAGEAETAAKQHAETKATAAEKAAKAHAEAEDKKVAKNAKDALDNYRKQVTSLIGEQGTLTKQLEGLGNQIESKLGAMGSVTLENQRHARLLQGIVNGADIPELSDTKFKQHQKLVNDMQAVFNVRVSDNQQAFRQILDAQQGWNELQEAFNRKQTGINKVYDAFWEEQRQRNKLQQEWNTEQQVRQEKDEAFRKLQLEVNDKQTGINALNEKWRKQQDLIADRQSETNLLQQYMTKYNRIMAISREAHPIDLALSFPSRDSRATDTGEYNPAIPLNYARANSGSLWVYLDVVEPLELMLNVSVAANTGGPSIVYSDLFMVRTKEINSMGLFLIGLRGDMATTARSGPFRASISGTAFPRETLPLYRNQLASLAREYRSKGLNV